MVRLMEMTVMKMKIMEMEMMVLRRPRMVMRMAGDVMVIVRGGCGDGWRRLWMGKRRLWRARKDDDGNDWGWGVGGKD
ncbi:hypothetical protein CRG98_011415 [Punica granatum]|uniref:Uncharacterized protein n=1 Tax=Punica granatum TaxID=22663 RepID=A0A2I0KKA6_PUNGR|nr:hypothetical protein CRG98_011415 [Punica granatum]